MSATVTVIRPQDLIVLDPSDAQTIQFDWDTDNLAAGVSIVTSTYTVTAVKQAGVAALTVDNAVILNGNRTTQARLLGNSATAGDKYRVANRIVTNEAVPQTKERSIQVLVQNR